MSYKWTRLVKRVTRKMRRHMIFADFICPHTKCMRYNWIEICISWKLIVLFVQIMKPFHPNYWKHESQSKNHFNSQLPKCPFFPLSRKISFQMHFLTGSGWKLHMKLYGKKSILNLFKRVYISINLTPNWNSNWTYVFVTKEEYLSV